MLERLKPVPATQLSPDRDSRRVKGTLVAARLRFLKGRGPEMFERVVSRMSAEDQSTLRGMVLPSSWYAADLLQRLEATAAAIVARGDQRALYIEMGRYAAQANLGPTGVQRAYVRAADPHFVLSNVPRMYGTQHTDGNREYERLSATAAVIRSYEARPPRAEDCLTTLGWLTGAVECSGGREVQVEERSCRAKGTTHCEFHCSWV